MTLSYLVYQLAKNPGVQQKLQEEVDQAYEESQGEVSFFVFVCQVVFPNFLILQKL
jgi:cytochrome P450